MRKIRVLIIDDSTLARTLLKNGLSVYPKFDIVGTASDAYEGRDKIVQLKPDVITLDIEMPKMDGIDFLKRLMRQYPVPVVIVSALAAPRARATLDALEYGAVDFVLKPSTRIGTKLDEMIVELREKIVVASQTDVSRRRQSNRRYDTAYRGPSGEGSNVLVGTSDKVIAIGASTGGTVALRTMIQEFPRDMPGTVIVQHMPPVFTRMFAEKLNEISRVEVKEAADGDRILTGRVLVAPGDRHVTIIQSGGQYRVMCETGEKVHGHCPSVGVLFESVAKYVGPNAIGIMLTGMGRDGASGMLSMRNAGASTLAQDEATSVVFGMPKEAYECGGAERLIPIDRMTESVLSLVAETV